MQICLYQTKLKCKTKKDTYQNIYVTLFNNSDQIISFDNYNEIPFSYEL